MKALTLFIFIFGFTLSMLAITTEARYFDDDDDGDDDGEDEFVALDDPSEDFAVNENEDVAENLPSENQPEDDAKEFDVRSIDDVFDDYFSDEDDDIDRKLDKRWVYKCAPKECTDRCIQLLKLPFGECGFGGKCYCNRKSKKSPSV